MHGCAHTAPGHGKAGGSRAAAFLECVAASPGLGSRVLGSWSSAGGLWAVLSPQPGAPGSFTVPPARQRHPQPSWLTSNIYGNPFVLRWRFLGSDLHRPLFLSKMFCQIQISFIPSSSLTQRAPTSPLTHSTPCFPHMPRSQPQGDPSPAESLWIPGRLSCCLSTLQHCWVFTLSKVILFPRKTWFFPL